jgi:hypothetical protein
MKNVITLVSRGWKYQATKRPEIFHYVTPITATIILAGPRLYEFPS